MNFVTSMTGQRLFDPFDNRADSFKALQVVHRTFSTKLKNYTHVTNILNKVLGLKFDDSTIKDFIEQVIAYPLLYGYSSVENYSLFLEEIRSHSTLSKSPTIVLTPDIKECFICTQKHKLVIKKTKFGKDPLLFGLICVGRH
jgi:hypothetical protein